MRKKPALKFEKIEIGQFTINHFFDDERIEARYSFDRDDLSQKLIFTVHDICHEHGFGCTSPRFNGPNDPNMSFYVGTFVPTKSSLKKYVQRMYRCLLDIEEFSELLYDQLDFSLIDLTMFKNIKAYDFSPEHIAAIRDQSFGGSWSAFRRALIASNRREEAKMIDRCRKFEKINKKDVGFVGHKLHKIIEMVNDIDRVEN